MAQTLSEQAYAVLTIVALRGSATAYQIEGMLAQLAGEFWSAPHTQVYRLCEQLARSGLLRARQETAGRRRRVFALTSKGRDTISVWVRTATEQSMEIRDVAHLKLMASELSTTADVRELARAQVASYRRRLHALDEIESRHGARRELALRLQGIRMGRAVYEAALAFWADIAERPPRI
jgi:PadR family transcriptional regulator AphA